MNIESLKAEVEEYRAGLKQKTGSVCEFSETGPVGMHVIDVLVQALATQEKRLETLETNFEALLNDGLTE